MSAELIVTIIIAVAAGSAGVLSTVISVRATRSNAKIEERVDQRRVELDNAQQAFERLREFVQIQSTDLTEMRVRVDVLERERDELRERDVKQTRIRRRLENLLTDAIDLLTEAASEATEETASKLKRRIDRLRTDMAKLSVDSE